MPARRQIVDPRRRTAPTGSTASGGAATGERLVREPGRRRVSVQERLLELDMRRKELISELGVDLAHCLVRLVVGGEHRAQAFRLRPQERFDLDRRGEAAATI